MTAVRRAFRSPSKDSEKKSTSAHQREPDEPQEVTLAVLQISISLNPDLSSRFFLSLVSSYPSLSRLSAEKGEEKVAFPEAFVATNEKSKCH